MIIVYQTSGKHKVDFIEPKFKNDLKLGDENFEVTAGMKKKIFNDILF